MVWNCAYCGVDLETAAETRRKQLTALLNKKTKEALKDVDHKVRYFIYDRTSKNPPITCSTACGSAIRSNKKRVVEKLPFYCQRCGDYVKSGYLVVEEKVLKLKVCRSCIKKRIIRKISEYE